MHAVFEEAALVHQIQDKCLNNLLFSRPKRYYILYRQALRLLSQFTQGRVKRPEKKTSSQSGPKDVSC